MTYLVKISDVDEPEIFKICLEYWHHLAHDLYKTECQGAASKEVRRAGRTGCTRQLDPHAPSTSQVLAGTTPAPGRKALYAPLLTQVRLVMISHMVKPEEVLIKEDDSGDIVRTTMKDSEALAQYKTMRETLVYLTHLDYDDTEMIMLGKLAKQGAPWSRVPDGSSALIAHRCTPRTARVFAVDGSEWSWHRLNTLCWAIGSISGAMNEAVRARRRAGGVACPALTRVVRDGRSPGLQSEKRFVVTVIKDLLLLCEMKSGKKNKAVVASNIMYVAARCGAPSCATAQR